MFFWASPSSCRRLVATLHGSLFARPSAALRSSSLWSSPFRIADAGTGRMQGEKNAGGQRSRGEREEGKPAASVQNQNTHPIHNPEIFVETRRALSNLCSKSPTPNPQPPIPFKRLAPARHLNVISAAHDISTSSKARPSDPINYHSKHHNPTKDLIFVVVTFN